MTDHTLESIASLGPASNNIVMLGTGFSGLRRRALDVAWLLGHFPENQSDYYRAVYNLEWRREIVMVKSLLQKGGLIYTLAHKRRWHLYRGEICPGYKKSLYRTMVDVCLKEQKHSPCLRCKGTGKWMSNRGRVDVCLLCLGDGQRYNRDEYRALMLRMNQKVFQKHWRSKYMAIRGIFREWDTEAERVGGKLFS